MVKYISYLFLILIISCENKKITFLKSEANQNIILVKNTSNDYGKTKNAIKSFILKVKPTNDVLFYKYDYLKTRYFLENKEDYSGGLSGEEISFYTELGIVELNIIRINNCSIKAELKYLNNEYGNYYSPDTINYNCK